MLIAAVRFKPIQFTGRVVEEWRCELKGDEPDSPHNHVALFV